MPEDTATKLTKLQSAAEAARTRLAQIQGEQAAAEKQLKTLSEECQTAFDCTLEQLPKVYRREEAQVAELLEQHQRALDDLQRQLDAAQADEV